MALVVVNPHPAVLALRGQHAHHLILRQIHLIGPLTRVREQCACFEGLVVLAVPEHAVVVLEQRVDQAVHNRRVLHQLQHVLLRTGQAQQIGTEHCREIVHGHLVDSTQLLHARQQFEQELECVVVIGGQRTDQSAHDLST